MGELHRLVRKNDSERVRSALRDSATAYTLVNEVDEVGCTPLLYAVLIPDTSLTLFDTLLAARADMEYRRPFRDLSEAEEEVLSQIANEVPESTYAALRYPSKASITALAVRQVSIEKLRLMEAHGADFQFRTRDGSTALHHAIYGDEARLPVVRYFLAMGFDPSAVNDSGETPLRLAYPQPDLIKALLEANADEDTLEWNPLIRAILLGAPEEVETVLQQTREFEARDWQGRTALYHAVRLRNLDLAKRIRERSGQQAIEDSILLAAVDNEDLDMVEWLLEQGADPNSQGGYGEWALRLAALDGNLPMVEALLRSGADPRAKNGHGSVIEDITHGEVIDLLLRSGVDPRDLGHAERRYLLGLGEITDTPLREVTPEQYLAGCYHAETTQNPEETTGAFRVAMIRAGVWAYRARDLFGEPYPHRGEPLAPIWTIDRFGQSLTKLPDGRTILIAGEHEDSYDIDFCIYNDVVVFHADGRIQIFGYPYELFPPTDFHTATLVGDHIYIVGSLGYQGQRQTGMPVWRLNVSDYRIEPLQTTGRDPGRVFEHRAALLDDKTIEISEGKRLRFKEDEETVEKNEETFRLNLETLTWS